MRLIRKSVKEDYTQNKTEQITDEPNEDINTVKTSEKDAAYKQAILTAIGSETGAWNEYNTILEMESEVNKDLVEHFHNTIEDIRNEEMKHVGQLTEKISELPDMKAAYDAGKLEAEKGNEESLDTTNKDNNKDKEKKEATLMESIVEKNPDKTRLFNPDKIGDVISLYPKVKALDPLTAEQVEDLTYKYFYDEDADLTAQEVDLRLEDIIKVIKLSPEEQEELERQIIATTDPAIERIEEFKEDMSNDIGLLKGLIENLVTAPAVSKVWDIIHELETIEYNGEKDIGWKVSNTIYGSNPTKKVFD